MPIDETLLEPVGGIDESLLEDVDPNERVLSAGTRPTLAANLTPYGPTVDIPIPDFLDKARRTIIGPTPEEASLLEQRVLPRVSEVERLGVLGLLNKPTITVPEWPRIEGDVPISGLPSAAFGAVWNAVVKPALEGLSSPGGIASAGGLNLARQLAVSGRLGVARAIAAPSAAVFGAPMAANAPAASRAFGTASVEGGTQDVLETGLQATATVALPGTLAIPAMRPGRIRPPGLPETPAIALPADLPPAVVPRGTPTPRPVRARPEVPATAAEPYETVLQTIRKGEARTIAQIQGLFPRANLSREQARTLRNMAYPETAKAPEAPATPEPVATAPKPVQAAPEPIAAPETLPPVAEAPKPVQTPPVASVASDLAIPALGLTEADLTLPKIRALPMNNPALWARLQQYFGAKTVPEVQARVKARFDEMRAASGERAPEPVTSTPIVPPPPLPKPAVRPKKSPVSDRPWDIIDEIENSIGRIRTKGGMRAGEEGYYGDAYNAVVRSGARRLLSKTGQSWDSVTDSLRRSGWLGEDADVRTLQEIIARTQQERLGWKSGKATRREDIAIEQAVAQEEAFDQAARQPKKGVPAVSVAELSEGDTFKLEGVDVVVKELVWDPETLDLAYVVVEDGTKFGVKTVNGDSVIYPDKGSLKQKELSTEFLPPGEEAAAAPEPFQLEGVGRDQVRAEEAAQAKAQASAKAKEDLAARAAAPLVGDSSDVGQGKLLAGDEDLFSGPSAELSVGPGAASFLEFEQRVAQNARRAAAGQRPPGTSPPVVLPPPLPSTPPPLPEIASKKAPNDIISKVNSPQFVFWFGKRGPTAKAAWEKMALADLEIRESIGRDVQTFVDDTLRSLPRKFRRNGGQAFFDVLDGKTPEQIRAAWEGKPGGEQIIAAADAVKQRLEVIRTTIRDTKRDTYRAVLLAMDKPTLQSLFSNTIDSAVDISRYSKDALANALTLSEFPDNWGFADGSYMPHLFLGEQRATVRIPGDEAPRFVLRGQTPAEVRAKVYELVRKNPELAQGKWAVEKDTVMASDMVRLGDRRFWKLVNDMAERGGITDAEVKAAIKGNIGRQASKQKWWGSLQRRYGYANFERNYKEVMGKYLTGFHRWRVLSKLNREVVPMIEQVRREGRPNAANALQDILDYQWGKPAETTKFVDAVIEQVPGLNQVVKPLALDRWSRNLRGSMSTLMLLTPRYALVNRLQPLQGLYPLVGERLMLKSSAFRRSDAGKKVLDEAGVRFDPGQYQEHSFIVPNKLQEIRANWSGERANQEIAFSAMYLHARETGLSHADAIPYAKIRGQLLTQFTPIPSDIPPVMRGPFTGLLFQFKRFPIKQAELLFHLGRSGAGVGVARWIAAMALTGGAAFFMRQFYLPSKKREEFKRAMVSRFGEPAANAVMYGAPGMLGTDISSSLTLGDEPWGENIYEKAGRALVGPFASSTIETVSALTKDKREPMTVRENLEVLLRRYPTLRPLAELSQMARGDVDIKGPDGEKKYRRTFLEAIRGLGSFRSTDESNARIAADAAVKIEQERVDLKNAFYLALQKGSTDDAVSKLQQFNARWPEFAIQGREVVEYVKRRARGANETDLERAVGKRYRSMLPESRLSDGEDEE